jgi:hypothetical protein
LYDEKAGGDKKNNGIFEEEDDDLIFALEQSKREVLPRASNEPRIFHKVKDTHGPIPLDLLPPDVTPLPRNIIVEEGDVGVDPSCNIFYDTHVLQEPGGASWSAVVHRTRKQRAASTDPSSVLASQHTVEAHMTLSVSPPLKQKKDGEVLGSGEGGFHVIQLLQCNKETPFYLWHRWSVDAETVARMGVKLEKEKLWGEGVKIEKGVSEEAFWLGRGRGRVGRVFAVWGGNCLFVDSSLMLVIPLALSL